MAPEKTKILIVDDDQNFCYTLSKILIQKGYETETANDGFMALKMAEEKEFDTVLMDIKMPVMDGVQTYKKMKSIRPEIVVIMMTAFSIDDLIRDAIKEGAYAVARKPFDIDTIVNMIEKSKNGALVAVVDDDPNIGKTMKSVLEGKGYSVTVCSSGEEVIALARERWQDIFFIDMKLPVLNGLETYLEIKRINPKAIVVAMTAYRQEVNELIEQAIKSGVYSVLYKPFDMDDAIKLIDEISNRPKA
jgi:DNA-binding NtrC family response regulator